ncbi:MAG: dual specificity protein phosphatase family protein [Chloroflexi bacterium]|nr:dual specificity protein phosphatase family protein [Chloroflexota bacterium]
MNAARSWLFIGKYRETRNLPLLRSHNIGAMLQLAELVEQPGIETLYLPVDDGVPLPVNLLQKGIDFVTMQKAQGKTVLISCGAGISRSAAFVTAVLKETENLDLLTALKSVQQKHPVAMPHPAIWQSLCIHYNENIPFLDTLIS